MIRSKSINGKYRPIGFRFNRWRKKEGRKKAAWPSPGALRRLRRWVAPDPLPTRAYPDGGAAGHAWANAVLMGFSAWARGAGYVAVHRVGIEHVSNFGQDDRHSLPHSGDSW
jgi:hypothetical protein